MNGNTPRTAICCAATSPLAHVSGRGHPLESCAPRSGRREGENRGAMGDVLPRTHIRPSEHPGSVLQIFPAQNISGGW